MLAPGGFKTGSPADRKKRGSHVSLKHPEAFRICKALIAPENAGTKVIPDFREPDNIRFGFTPLYTTFTEIRLTVERLKEIVETGEFEMFSNQREKVT
jgi:kynureninase